MVDYLFWGMIILFVSTVIYYLVFFGLSYYYHEKKIQIVIVPVIYAFEFFLIMFLVVSLAVIVLRYLPQFF